MDPAYDSLAVLAVRDLLMKWGTEADYEAASGMDPATNQPLPESGETAIEVRAAQATLVFNTFLVRLVGRVMGDELAHAGTGLGSQMRANALLRLTLEEPQKLATYDVSTGQSILWDDMTTPGPETKDEQFMRALLDALATLKKDVSPDLGEYRWGGFHTIRFAAIIPLFGQLAIPPVGNSIFPNGFPRHGDNFAVDVANFGLSQAPDMMPRFAYGSGPTQRFVVDMDPAGPKAWNALPGGAIWDSQSPHFADSAELWRRNETRPVPFLLPDVVAAAESRLILTKR